MSPRISYTRRKKTPAHALSIAAGIAANEKERAFSSNQDVVEESSTFLSVDSDQRLPPHIRFANNKQDFREEVTLRYHSIAGYLFRWNGTVTQYSWPKVVAYACYVALVSLFSNLHCPSDENEDTNGPYRCRLSNYYTELGEAFGLWFVFTAFLFQSFVNAGLKRFSETLTLLRRVQGRFHEIGMLLHSHALPPAKHTLSVLRRYLLALVYLMFDDAKYGPHDGAFLPLVAKILEPDEYRRIESISKPSDRPHAVMTWILTLVQTALANSGGGDGNEPPLFQGTNALGLQVSQCLESLRGTHGSLTDLNADPIMPFPFAHLIIANVFLEFLLLPWLSMGQLGYWIIPIATIYFWFLDGMITFVFLVDDPFVDNIGGRRVEPLIDVHRIIAEIAAALPRRYPTAMALEPISAIEIIRSPLSSCSTTIDAAVLVMEEVKED